MLHIARAVYVEIITLYRRYEESALSGWVRTAQTFDGWCLQMCLQIFMAKLATINTTEIRIIKTFNKPSHCPLYKNFVQSRMLIIQLR